MESGESEQDKVKIKVRKQKREKIRRNGTWKENEKASQNKETVERLNERKE